MLNLIILIPLFAAVVVNALPFRRKGQAHHSMHLCRDLLNDAEKKNILIVFPEGTRSIDGSIGEFRRLLDDTKRVMKIDREVALSEVADLSILKEAQRELGIK